MKLAASVTALVSGILGVVFGVVGLPWFGLLFGVVGLVVGLCVLLDIEFVPLSNAVNRLRETRTKAVAAQALPELDFSGKRARQEAWVKEWQRGWFDALGDDREAFVRQWAEGSRRYKLAVRLRDAEALADTEGRVWEANALYQMRCKVTASPEREMPVSTLDQIERFVASVERDRVRGNYCG
jgi:hypothetical protein